MLTRRICSSVGFSACLAARCTPRPQSRARPRLLKRIGIIPRAAHAQVQHNDREQERDEDGNETARGRAPRRFISLEVVRLVLSLFLDAFLTNFASCAGLHSARRTSHDEQRAMCTQQHTPCHVSSSPQATTTRQTPTVQCARPRALLAAKLERNARDAARFHFAFAGKHF